jgi:phycocyanobilin:ferredoxin oxidoreductase
MKILHPIVTGFAESILKSWHEQLDLIPLKIPEDIQQIQYEEIDIANFMWESERFRKIHLEIAKIGDTLDIVHVNMYPRYGYNIPIFGADIVASTKSVGAAIVDITPINKERSLSNPYKILDIVDKNFENPKKFPDWGNVFSEYCIFVRPTEDEYQKFIDTAFTYLNYHCCISQLEKFNEKNIEEHYSGQKYYCDMQRKNNKTFGVLRKIFGQEYAHKYITEILFDYPEVN